MTQYIDKAAVVAEIRRLKNDAETFFQRHPNPDAEQDYAFLREQYVNTLSYILSFLDTIEVKENLIFFKDWAAQQELIYVKEIVCTKPPLLKLRDLEEIESILSHYGIRHQIRKFAEEAYELQEAVIEQETLQDYTAQKGNFDNEHVAEELADVLVVWSQIRLHYNISRDKIAEIVNAKINRQIKRIEDETSSDQQSPV